MIYIALLRGINVNGQNMIKMEQLRNIFDEMQFQKVKTYIQTGNVIFNSSEEDKDYLCKKIEDKLKVVFGLEIPVILRNLEDLKSVIASNPFNNRNLLESEKLHVTFLAGEPLIDDSNKLKDYKEDRDEIILQRDNVYILCRNGYGKTKFTNSFFENKLKVKATTRNLNTLNKIVELGMKE